MSEELLMDVDKDKETDDSISSESSDEIDPAEQELLEKAKQLQEDLIGNKYLYDHYIELLEIYRKLSDLSSLRKAFYMFQEYFPLTPNIWLDFIKTESNLATDPKQQKKIFKLFDFAVEDYLSVNLWIEYVQFSLGTNDIESTRSTLERGLTAVGLVCDKGSLLWDILREIEYARVALYEKDSEEWKKQVMRLADAFKRQLSVPLLDMEKTYYEWQEWFKTLPEGLVDGELIEHGYKSALKLLETYKPFEERLLLSESNEELYNTYKEYIETISDPSTIICLYERAALHLCLVPDFWLEYCNYSFKLGDAALTVCNKALRNCPNSEELWIFKIRVLENLNKGLDEVMKCFEEAMTSIAPSAGLELWLAYIEFNLRVVGLVEKTEKLFNYAMEHLEFKYDPNCKVKRLFARVLAQKDNMKYARKIWTQILCSDKHKRTATYWIEYANLERQYGEPMTIRSVFQKALKDVKDYPENVIEEWLLYERQYGKLEDVMTCVEKCKNANIIQRYQEVSEVVNDERYQPARKKRKRQEDDRDYNEEKRRPRLKRNPNTTVFVRNLHWKVDENTLKKIFPSAINLEIVVNHRQQSKGFGFIEFKTKEEVLDALARDKEIVEGRPIFISPMQSEQEKRAPITDAVEEKNKLFIRGLPPSTTQEQIVQIYEKFGAKDARLVPNKSGRFLAYIDFETEEQAQHALKETNQTTVNDHVITVMISAPPPKPEKFQKKPEKEPSRHARSRLQTSLLPRSLQVKTEEKPRKETKADEEKVKDQSKEKITEVEMKDSKKLSNADFKKILFRK